MAGAESQTVVVLGIDPGLANTGYGVVALRGGRLLALDGGVIQTPAELSAERRLAQIHAAVSALIDEHQPHAMALEELYFGQNVRTAFAVGQARGVVMLAAASRTFPVAATRPSSQGRGLRLGPRAEGPGGEDGDGPAEPDRGAAPRSCRRRARCGALPRQLRALASALEGALA